MQKPSPILVCDKCGFTEQAEQVAPAPVEMEVEAGSASIKVVGDREEKIKTMPTTNVECPKCGHNTAFWWFLQTRSGDEPPTQFFRCEKCAHTWRQYS
jgi:transcription factor S